MFTPVWNLLCTNLKLFLRVSLCVYWIIWVCKSLTLNIVAFEVPLCPSVRTELVCVPLACCSYTLCKFARRRGGRPFMLSVTLCLAAIWDCLCVFSVPIIMGCSLLLSNFLFIVLILALGSSLTSQGCLRCGNQGKLYLPKI